MRLPWVSRQLYIEKGVAAIRLCAQVEALRVTLEREQKRFEALLEKYHALKLQGAVAVEPQAPIARKEVDLVVQRINILSAGKPGLRAAMLNQLSDDRLLRGLGDIEILQRIEAGVTTDDGVMA